MKTFPVASILYIYETFTIPMKTIMVDMPRKEDFSDRQFVVNH